jgi:uncharacterized protein Yka (UPF0111/DUF47 family)
MKPRRWLLPDVPDVIGLLCEQARVTVDGMEAMLAWAQGEPAAADQVRLMEHEADTRRREVRDVLTQMFAPPLDPEDLFTLSVGIDEVINGAKDTVREAELMEAAPDAAMAEIAAELLAGTRDLADAFAALGDRAHLDTATAAADRAIKRHRNIEHVYRRAMSSLIGVEDLGVVTTKRELYRRLVRTSGDLAGVAERVWYAVLKQS